MSTSAKSFLLVISLALTACGGSGTAADGGQGSDAATDSATDSGNDAATDSSTDAGNDCSGFCTQELSVCTATNTQYANQGACLTACTGWVAGTAGDTSGNSFACRSYHLGLAATSSTNATIHCPHTGPSGGGVCQ